MAGRKFTWTDYLVLILVVALFFAWLYLRYPWLRYAVWVGCILYFLRRLWVGYKYAKEQYNRNKQQ